jgi:hypothetical protein
MSSPATRLDNDNDDDAALEGFRWIDQDSPDHPPETQTQFFDLVSVPNFRNRAPTIFYRPCSIEATLSFNLACKLWRWTPLIGPRGEHGASFKVFSCSVEETRFLPAKLVPEVPHTLDAGGNPAPTVVGPYTESINLQMEFPDARAMLHSRSPDTDVQRGAVTTSVSYSFNGGFFGATPTEGVSATYSHSATMDLTDYLIRSDSGEAKTDHTVLMEMLADGNRYTDVPSLDYEEFPPKWHASKDLLTARSTSDLTMAMQGIWLLPDVADEVVFRVTVAVVCPVLANRLPEFAVVPVPSLPEGAVLGTPLTMTREQWSALASSLHYPDNLKFKFVWVRDVKVDLSAVDKPQPQGEGE